MYTLKIIVIAAILLVFILLIVFYLNWKFGLSINSPRISFKTFQTMYNINPDSFILCDSYIRYKDEYIELSSFIDVIRFIIFSRKLDKEKNEKIKNRRSIELLESFQKDIDDYKEQQESELKQYSDAIIKQVKESTERYEKMKGELYASNNR